MSLSKGNSILVVSTGVFGLSTALELEKRGYSETVEHMRWLVTRTLFMIHWPCVPEEYPPQSRSSVSET